MLDSMPGPRPGDNLWHKGCFAPNTDMLCNIELIGGEFDIARVQWYSNSCGGGQFMWIGGKSTYELYEVRRWRYIPEPPKAPTPPPPRYVMEGPQRTRLLDFVIVLLFAVILFTPMIGRLING